VWLTRFHPRPPILAPAGAPALAGALSRVRAKPASRMGKEPRPGDNEAGAQYTHTEDREVFQHPISMAATELTLPSRRARPAAWVLGRLLSGSGSLGYLVGFGNFRMLGKLEPSLCHFQEKHLSVGSRERWARRRHSVAMRW
jgi:hypothetical protein